MQLSVNRKSTAVWWMGCWTVRVHVVRFGATDDSHLKANEGAERSCSKKRRIRGQRIGKERSRGRQPRSNLLHPTPESKEPKDRKMNMHLRACDHWYDRQEQFGELFKQSRLSRELLGNREFSWDVYRVWKTRWKSLHDRIRPYGEGVSWCSRIGPSFSYWLEQRFGIVIDRHRTMLVSARSTLVSMHESIRIRNYHLIPRATGNRSLAPRFLFRCAFCPRRAWTSDMRVGRCPHCSRPAVGMGGIKSIPKRNR